MIAYFGTLETDTRFRVGKIHFKPEQLTEEQLVGAIMVETHTEPEVMPRKVSVLYVNPQTLETWYEYIDRPPTQEELMQDFVVEMEKMKQLALHNYPVWRTGHNYVVGELCLFGNDLYETVQSHTSQSDWTPNIVPALFKVKNPDDVISAWVQPTGAHDAYAQGSKVIHGEHVWVSIIPNNVWEPGVYGWTIVW